jgi:methylated-DNA-[protein]-cysteine S-methyltransferase
MSPTLVQYDAPGFGVGEVWLDERGRVFHTELPRPYRSRLAPGAGRALGGRSSPRSRAVGGELPRPDRTRLAPGARRVFAGRVSAEEECRLLAARLSAFFAGADDDFRDVRLQLPDGFHGACARALLRVRRGDVVTYGELAALAGCPGAARAAGTFCARCDLSPFVPTHRVVAAGGIGSYGDLGVDYKRRLLALEGVAL